MTKFAYDGWNPSTGTPVGNENWDVWADLNVNRSLQTRYLRGDQVDQLFARLDVRGEVDWTLTDRLGSVRHVVSGSGQILDAISYDGYGNITSQTNPAELGRYAWTGRELDIETDLQYNRARYYDPIIGRWTGLDPMGFDAGDSNLYRYVQNQPLQESDPSGLERRIVLYQTWEEMRKNGVPESEIDYYKRVGAEQFATPADLIKKAGLKGSFDDYVVEPTPLLNKDGKQIKSPSGAPLRGIVIRDAKTNKIVRVGWEAGYAGTYYGYYLFDSEAEMQQHYAAGIQVMKVMQGQVLPFLAGAGVGLSLPAAREVGQPARAIPLTREQLLQELARQGVRHTPENIVFIARIQGGRIIFLETGTAQAGLQHIVMRHGADFAARGVTEAQIPALIRAALTEGRIVGTAGSGANVRNIYEVVFRGVRQRLAIGTGSNGFVVTAFPQ